MGSASKLSFSEAFVMQVSRSMGLWKYLRRNRPKIAPKLSAIAPGSRPKRQDLLPEAFEVQFFGPSSSITGPIFIDFWTISGRLLGSKILPKSLKIVSGRRSISDTFSDLRFNGFLTRFGLPN